MCQIVQYHYTETGYHYSKKDIYIISNSFFDWYFSEASNQVLYLWWCVSSDLLIRRQMVVVEFWWSVGHMLVSVSNISARRCVCSHRILIKNVDVENCMLNNWECVLLFRINVYSSICVRLCNIVIQRHGSISRRTLYVYYFLILFSIDVFLQLESSPLFMVMCVIWFTDKTADGGCRVLMECDMY